MSEEQNLKNLKVVAGTFFEEMKSNSVTELIVWIDCKLEKQRFDNTQISKVRPR